MSGPASDDFAALALEAVSNAALERAQSLGCSHAEVRIERIHTQVVALRDGVVESVGDDHELGMGLRIVHEGAIGFAATVELDADGAVGLADSAVEAATITARAGGRRVELAPEPSYGTVQWVSPYAIDPFSVPLSEKVALLES